MEAKHLASVFSFLSIFLAIYAQHDSKDINNNNRYNNNHHNNNNNNNNNINNEEDDDSTEYELESAIYYGDSNVNIGDPFSITCIIPVTDPVSWMKDSEPIVRHNLRHGHDEHAYVISENAFEGEKHKIEAHLSVRHALKVHEGRYQCNFLHTSSHMLHVHPAVVIVTSETISPFIITANPKFSSGGSQTSPSTTTISSSTATTTTTNKDNPWLNAISNNNNNNDYENERSNNLDRYKEHQFGHGGTSTQQHQRIHVSPEMPPSMSEANNLSGSSTTTSVGGKWMEPLATDLGQQQGIRTHNRQHHNYQHQRPQKSQVTKTHRKELDEQLERQIIYINATHFAGIPRPASAIISDSNKNIGSGRPDRIPTDQSSSSDENAWEYISNPSTSTLPSSSSTGFGKSLDSNSEYTTISEWRLGQQQKYPKHQYTLESSHRNTELELLPPETTSPAAATGNILYYTPIFEHDESGSISSIGTATSTATTTTSSQNFGGRISTHHRQHSHSQQQATMAGTEYDTTSILYGTTPRPYSPAFSQSLAPPQSGIQHHGHSKNVQQSRPQSVGHQVVSGEGAINMYVTDATRPIIAATPSVDTTKTAVQTLPAFVESQMSQSGPATMILAHNEPDLLVPNYDNEVHQMKFYEIRSPLVLSCNITKEGKFELTWQKNGTDVAKVKELQGRHRIISAEWKFIIDRTERGDDGLYSCSVNDVKKYIVAVAHVAVRVPSNTGVVEGEKLSIVCTVVGTDPQLSWQIGNNLTISNSTGRFTLAPNEGVANAIITMDNTSLDDRGDFKCIGRNAANEYGGVPVAEDVSLVRVKGKLAALWPFLGICAEVLILCTIILIYEKRRNKSELEESDTDGQDQKKKRRNYD